VPSIATSTQTAKENTPKVDAVRRIVVPSLIVGELMEWYNKALKHTGVSRMYRMIGQYFWWKGLKCAVEVLVTMCDVFQKLKISNKKKYGIVTEN
jgi:hypothetical protein